MWYETDKQQGGKEKKEGEKTKPKGSVFDNNEQWSKQASYQKKINKQLKNFRSDGINQRCSTYSPLFSPLASLTDCSPQDGQPHDYVWLLQWLSIIQEYILKRKNNGLNKPFSFAHLGNPNTSISRARSSNPALFYQVGEQSKTHCQWGTWNCLWLVIKTVLVSNWSHNKKTVDLVTSRPIPVNLSINCKDKLCFRIQRFLGETFLWLVIQSPLNENY